MEDDGMSLSLKISVTISVVLIFVVGIIIMSVSHMPIKIGFAACLTGANSELGVTGSYGAQIAIDEINEAGGVLGRKLELLVRDDQNNAEEALRVDKSLVDDGVLAIIGHMTSNMVEKTFPYINEHHVLMISPTISTDAVVAQDDYFYRLIPSNSQQAEILAKKVIADHYMQIDIITEQKNKAFTEPFKEVFKKHYTSLGGQVIVEQAFTTGNKDDYKQMAKELSKSGAKAILILAPSYDTANIAQQIYKEGLKRKGYLAAWAITNDLIELGGSTVEGYEGTFYLDLQSQNEAYEKFYKKYVLKYGNEPTFSAMMSYEAVMVLKDTLEKTRYADVEAIRRMIKGVKTYNGLQSTLIFDEYGDMIRPIYFVEIKDGKFVKGD